MDVLGVLWDPLYDAKYVIDYGFGDPLPLGAASPEQRRAEANRLLAEMLKQQAEIDKLILSPTERERLQAELDAERVFLNNQIRYFRHGCDRATGLLTRTFSTGGQGRPVTENF